MSFGIVPIDAPANALWSPPIAMSLRTQKRAQKAPAVAGTASIRYALPDEPAALWFLTSNDELPACFWVVSIAKSRLQSPGAALTA